jgi:hypothetical protein
MEVHPDRLELVGLCPAQQQQMSTDITTEMSSAAEVRAAGYIPSRTLPLAPFVPFQSSL